MIQHRHGNSSQYYKFFKIFLKERLSMENEKKVLPSLQSVERTLKLLRLFSEQQPDLSLSEISRLLMTSKPVALKYLNTLQAFGFLKRNEKNKRYSLGFELIKLGNLARLSNSIKSIARPAMTKLANETGESVFLLVPDLPFYQAICIDSIESPQTVVSKFRMSSPLYAGSSKKTILAYLGEEYLQSLLANMNLIPFTKNTVVDPITLVEQLAEIRARGYAISQEETIYDAGAVGAPIFDSLGIAGSLCLYVPLYRFTQDRMAVLIEKTVTAAEEVSARLGHIKK